MPTLPDIQLTTSDNALFSKIASRLLPFLFLLYLVSYLDRVNVSFASLPMERDLAVYGFNHRVYSSAGIFFLGYALFEIPSNLILQRMGARTWMCRIMLTWGMISACMMFIRGPWSFYILRLSLGIAEAGFFPGMILYLTYWFPSARRARAVALFMTSTAAAGVVGAPMSALLLRLEGVMGLHGWQWLFLTEGLPAIVLGFVVYLILPDGPASASWLQPDEKQRLETVLRADDAVPGGHHATDFRAAFKDRRIWLLTYIYFCIVLGLYCMSLWLPQIINQVWPGHADWQVSLMSGIPYGAAAIGMVAVGLHSDRTRERRFHAAGSLLVGAGGAIAAALLSGQPALSLISLSVAAMGIWGAFGPFWAMPSAFLGGTAAAGGIALINSLGCLSGWIGPKVLGALKEPQGSFSKGLWMMALVLLAGAVGAVCVKPEAKPAMPIP